MRVRRDRGRPSRAHDLHRTRLNVAEHQRRTVENFLELRDIAPDLPFVPVLQGYASDGYQRCADLYDTVGIDLATAPWSASGQCAAARAPKRLAGLSPTCTAVALHGCMGSSSRSWA